MVSRRLELDEGRPIARQLREANRVLMEVITACSLRVHVNGKHRETF